MRLGINQIMLLRRCRNKGYINLGDVRSVYGRSRIRRSYQLNDPLTPVLEKLEVYGLIEKKETRGRAFYVLTMKGERVLEENLKRIMEVG